ncbi:hypothetical protein P7K49_029454 [Saguinus oedipus]|uniref:Uncharacterized protein n=1 Tax=Saguinus oedipus TaxID=9490 RepID=A0ABQ9U815_SAGOE|nr:hypothetical protein P7K49_029454 [Saguinus oedipus]
MGAAGPTCRSSETSQLCPRCSGENLAETSGPEQASPQLHDINPRVPNPVVCLGAGNVLHILAHNHSASHYPVYQKQHLFNSNPHWDSGAFRRLSHLVQETRLNFSRFAHQFLDPGTYVLQDNGQPESLAVVLVKEEGVACGPGLSPVQPSSPYQLGRHGILRHRLPNLGPDWAVITGSLEGSEWPLCNRILLSRPPSRGAAGCWLSDCAVDRPGPPAEALPAPYLPHAGLEASVVKPGTASVPAEYVLLTNSLPFYEDLGPRRSGEGADSEKAMSRGTGEPLRSQTLEDFSVRTLYNKLEDKNLHVASQLSKHRSDALAFYRATAPQLQWLQVSPHSSDCHPGSSHIPLVDTAEPRRMPIAKRVTQPSFFQDSLQYLSRTELQALGRDGDPETDPKATAREDTGQSQKPWDSHTAASLRECQQPPPGEGRGLGGQDGM